MPDKELLDEFRLAQAGAVDHLETMAQVARDAAEEVTTGPPLTTAMRSFAQRLTQAADRCDALGVLVSLLDLPLLEDVP